MDSRSRFLLGYTNSSPGLRQIPPGPQQSPCPHVPDITESNTGLEWFEMATSTGPPTSRDQGVPRSPCDCITECPGLTALQLCSSIHPSAKDMEATPQPEEELWTGNPAHCSTESPLAQTVPIVRQQRVFEKAQPMWSGCKETPAGAGILVGRRAREEDSDRSTDRCTDRAVD